LVVDGGSTDDTCAVIQSWKQRDARIELVYNPAGNTSAGLNAGIAHATGDIVVRVDGHVLIAPDYVRRCVLNLAGTGADVVGGYWVGLGRNEVGQAVALALGSPFGAGDAQFRLPNGIAGPADTVYLGSWQRETLVRLRGFDTRLARNQDYELNVRVRDAGGLVWLAPDIRSRTLTRDRLSQLWRQYADYGAAKASVVALHPTSLRWRQVAPPLLVGTLLAATALRGVSRTARVIGLTTAGLYAGANLAATVSVAGQVGWRRARLLPLIYAIIHFGWGLGFLMGGGSLVLQRLTTWLRAASHSRADGIELEDG
jgi:hypothetical protein